MKNLVGLVMVGALGALCVVGCKKKDAGTAAGGSGSAMMGSDTMGSATGSGSAMMGSGSAMMGSDTMGSATGSAMGSAMGSGSAGMGSDTGAMGSATGSAAGSGAAGAAAAAAAHWNCKKTCKLAVSCKSPNFKTAKECETDCTKLENDTDGRYARGSIEGTPYYTCMDKAKDCAASKKCDHP